MRYVILRDDDTNTFTPVECLEQLYRPFLDWSLPVNLSVIPNVRTDATTPDGRPEEFLFGGYQAPGRAMPLGHNEKLVRYLQKHPGYCLAQHGYHHEAFEFERVDRLERRRRLQHGISLLVEAGFPQPETFVAPHDRMSRGSLSEVARHFHVFSSGWFELGRIPFVWWPKYVFAKARQHRNWQVGRTILLGHPGCLLSFRRPYDSMLAEVKKTIARCHLTVLVTHWWEYFRGGNADQPFIQILHETARYLADDPDITVVSFDEVAAGKVPVY